MWKTVGFPSWDFVNYATPGFECWTFCSIIEQGKPCLPCTLSKGQPASRIAYRHWRIETFLEGHTTREGATCLCSSANSIGGSSLVLYTKEHTALFLMLACAMASKCRVLTPLSLSLCHRVYYFKIISLGMESWFSSNEHCLSCRRTKVWHCTHLVYTQMSRKILIHINNKRKIRISLLIAQGKV